MDFESLLREAEEEFAPTKGKLIESEGESVSERPAGRGKPKTGIIKKTLEKVQKKPRPATTKDYSARSSDSDFYKMLDIEDPVSESEQVDPTLSIEERIRELKESTRQEVEQEKVELSQSNYEKILKTRQNFAESLELKKKLYEQELNDLERIKASYEKMESLTDNLGFNTNLLNNISQKISERKEENEYAKSGKLIDFERKLEERETRVLALEKQLEREKISVQDALENLFRMETSRRVRFEQEEKQIGEEKAKIYSIFQLISQQTQEKKQEILKDTQKIKFQQESLSKRNCEIRNGVDLKLQNLTEYEELLIQKHEETLKLVNQERRQLSEKREKLGESKREVSVFEEKIKQQSEIVEKRESELNYEVEELIRNKNVLESQRAMLESEMQTVHQLSLKLHSQSEDISKSKEQLEYEAVYLAKLEEDTENLKASSQHEMQTAKEYCKQLDQQMKTYEKMSVNLIQDLHSSIVTPFNFNI